MVSATADQDAGAYLRAIGERVREGRARRGMSRKSLAKDSGVSERYLALLEAGEGNGSVLLLRDVARALGVPLDTLLADGPSAAPDLSRAIELLRGLAPHDLARACAVLGETFGAVDLRSRSGRIALVGLRGAGKSTLGKRLAARVRVPFLELDSEVERDSGMTLTTIFDVYGQAGFRRMERLALERVLATHDRFVLAAGGGIVAEPATYARLRAACFTVWVRAMPSEHMRRVVAQGDMRPMGGDAQAMADLRRILATREELYREADTELHTSGQSVGQSVSALLGLIERAAP